MFGRVVLLLVVVFPVLANASESVPGVTDTTLNGVWEGVVGNWQVYRMDIRPHGQSYLAHVFSEGAVGLYHLTQRRVRDGRVFLRFERPNGTVFFPSVITLEGSGWANGYGSAGELRLTLRQLTHDKGSYPLHLAKGTHTRILAEFSRQAEHAIPR
jgi:hypothetical protein